MVPLTGAALPVLPARINTALLLPILFVQVTAVCELVVDAKLTLLACVAGVVT